MKRFEVDSVVEFVPGADSSDRGCWTQGIYRGPVEGRRGWHGVWNPLLGTRHVPSRRIRKPSTP